MFRRFYATAFRLAASGGEVHLRNIPSGSYEFWPDRGEQEVESIVARARSFLRFS